MNAPHEKAEKEAKAAEKANAGGDAEANNA